MPNTKDALTDLAQKLQSNQSQPASQPSDGHQVVNQSGEVINLEVHGIQKK